MVSKEKRAKRAKRAKGKRQKAKGKRKGTMAGARLDPCRYHGDVYDSARTRLLQGHMVFGCELCDHGYGGCSEGCVESDILFDTACGCGMYSAVQRVIDEAPWETLPSSGLMWACATAINRCVPGIDTQERQKSVADGMAMVRALVEDGRSDSTHHWRGQECAVSLAARGVLAFGGRDKYRAHTTGEVLRWAILAAPLPPRLLTTIPDGHSSFVWLHKPFAGTVVVVAGGREPPAADMAALLQFVVTLVPEHAWRRRRDAVAAWRARRCATLSR